MAEVVAQHAVAAAHAKAAMRGRGEVDTSSSFESVRQAVDLFGGGAVSRWRQPQAPPLQLRPEGREKMTAAARPTWAPAKGGNEARIFGSSQKYASRDLATRTTLKPRISRGKFTVSAITLDDYLPMRSTEVKNRTSSSDIKSLRVITAVKTPYLPDGRFDLEAYDSLINMQIDGGAEGVIVGGTAGEGHLMSWDEHIMLIGYTVNSFGTKIKVIGNTGSNSTREAVHATEQGFVRRVGLDGP